MSIEHSHRILYNDFFIKLKNGLQKSNIIQVYAEKVKISIQFAIILEYVS